MHALAAAPADHQHSAHQQHDASEDAWVAMHGWKCAQSVVHAKRAVHSRWPNMTFTNRLRGDPIRDPAEGGQDQPAPGDKQGFP